MTATMNMLGSASHDAEHLSAPELLSEAQRNVANAEHVRLILAQQGNDQVQLAARQAVPALTASAGRVQGRSARQADALRTTAELLSSVAGASQAVMNKVQGGAALLDALTQPDVVTPVAGATGLPALAEAVSIARQVVAFSRDPDLRGASGLLNTLSATLDRHAQSQGADLASIVMQTVASALQVQGDVESGRQRAFDVGMGGLQRAAAAAATKYSAPALGVNTAQRAAHQAVSVIMQAVTQTCINMQQAVTTGRSLRDVLGDADLVPALPPQLTVEVARDALQAVQAQEDIDSPVRRALSAAQEASRPGAQLGRDVILPLAARAAQDQAGTTSKYVSGALLTASKVLLARRAQLLEDTDARP